MPYQAIQLPQLPQSSTRGLQVTITLTSINASAMNKHSHFTPKICLIQTTFACGAIQHNILFREGCQCRRPGVETSTHEFRNVCGPPPPPPPSPLRARGDVRAERNALQCTLGLGGTGEREEEEGGKYPRVWGVWAWKRR